MTGTWIAPVGGDVSQRCEHKPALRVARMRNLQVRGLDDGAGIKKYVDIECPRPVANGAAAAESPLDACDAVQQLAREKRRFGMNHLIDEPALFPQTLRLRFVARGHAEDVKIGRRQRLNGAIQRRVAIALVRAETKKNLFQKSSG